MFMQCNHSGFSAAALVLAFFIAGLQKVQADCDVGTFYTPRKCQPKHVASYDWICETCPKDAIQYTSADETCVCKPRFFTEGGKYRCAEYLGNPNPTKATWPPVHDEFSCTMCDVPGDYCPGGAIWIRKDITEHQYYYEEDRSHVSGYKRVDMGVLQLRLGKYFAAEFVHAKKTFCQIYGQRMANDPWECECPSNSVVIYNTRKDDTMSQIGVWNHDIMPAQDTPLDSTVLKIESRQYFGVCNCKDGFFRIASTDNPVNYYIQCKECLAGAYCKDNLKSSCIAGWTTASNTSSTSAECNTCQPGLPSAGMYCNQLDAANHNTQAGAQISCPVGHKCPFAGMRAPAPCSPGEYQSVARSIACNPCESGKYTDVEKSTECKPCTAGKYSHRANEADPLLTSCTPCGRGKYSKEDGKSICDTCSGTELYQDEEGAQGCKTCPPGYKINSTVAVRTKANERLEDVCEPCPKGTYTDTPSASSCSNCSIGTFNDKIANTSCAPCKGELVTRFEGSQSESECICPAGRFDSTGNRECLPCGNCILNEYVASECNSGADIRCGACPSCPHVNQVVTPENMCMGTQAIDIPQKCTDCRNVCVNVQDVLIYSCFSGMISFDTTVCLEKNLYTDPLDFKCPGNFYQNPFAQAEEDYYAFHGDVMYINSNNSYIAELNTFSGEIRIYMTESSVNEPFVFAKDIGNSGASFPPVIRVQADPLDGNYRKYPLRYKVVVEGKNVSWAMSSAPNYAYLDRNVAEDVRVISSGAWSFDGSEFFVVWMDGTVSKAIVHSQVNRSFHMNWSPKPSRQSLEALIPVWAVTFPTTWMYSTLVKHSCSSVPVHYQIPLHKQIQLVCSYDYVKNANARKAWLSGESSPLDPLNSFGTYIVRILADGNRMPVDMKRHTLPFPSSSMLYDISFNVIYVTTYSEQSYSGKKRLMKVRLTQSYNFLSENQGRDSVGNASLPAQFQLPSVPSSVYPFYPLGISFDYAAIEPRSNSLFFYAVTEMSLDSKQNVLFYIPLDEITVGYIANGERNMQPIPVESGSSPYKNGILFSISAMYSIEFAPRLIFSLYNGVFVNMNPSVNVYYQISRCSPCQENMISDPGTSSLYGCRCDPRHYFNFETGQCVPITQECPYGHSISREATTTSDNFCLPCPVCSLGKYRDPADCVSTKYRNPSTPAVCNLCTGCDPGFYINLVRCNFQGNYPGTKSDCIPCHTCKEMQTIVGPVCPGTTVRNTQSCWDCTASCPDGTYISPHVERCNGMTRGSATEPFGSSDCTPCPGCPSKFQAMIGGCNGKTRYDTGTCVDCAICGIGEYIIGECSVSTEAVHNGSYQKPTSCQKCPVCDVGKYLAKSCTGSSLDTPDQICMECASCAADTFMMPCDRNNTVNHVLFLSDMSKESNPTAYYMAPPADAGICNPCRNCSLGYYTNRRCNGSTMFDTRTCAKCDSVCPSGFYMNARCKGDTFESNSNDCRPCNACNMGEYMSGGKCVDNTGATNGLQRVCKNCSSCALGKYRLSVCTGSSAYDMSGPCAPCQSCSPGYYVSKPCDGTGILGGYPDRVCSPCKQCPIGYYRVGCDGTSSSGEVQCLPCDPCPDGQYISPIKEEQCSGNGSSPIERRCISCPSCSSGRYYSSGCTGREMSNVHTCAACTSRCPSGTYIAMGCNGTTSRPTPEKCQTCRQCPDFYYISTPCSGATFSDSNRNCTRCTCPATRDFRPFVPCQPNGTSNHVCIASDGEIYPPYTPAPTPAPSPPPTQPLASTPQLATITTSTASGSVSSTPAPSSISPTPAVPKSTPVSGSGTGLGLIPIIAISAAACIVLIVVCVALSSKTQSPKTVLSDAKIVRSGARAKKKKRKAGIFKASTV